MNDLHEQAFTNENLLSVHKENNIKVLIWNMQCFTELIDCVNSALIGFLSLTDWAWMALYYMLDFSITADSQFHSASHNITGLFSNI